MATRVIVHCGDICTVPADVICSSTNPNLQLMAGTGGAIREAGGWSIQDQCNAVIRSEEAQCGHRWLMMGSVAWTTAGSLPYRGVIHCVAIDAFHGSSEEIIAQCTRNALSICADLNPPIASIAMPIFASGNAQFDFEISLRTMLDTIFNSHCSSVEKVLLVVQEGYQADLASKLLDEEFAKSTSGIREDG